MENYFLNCKTEEAIATRYRLHAVKMHPDKNPQDPEGSKIAFQEMINQRDHALKNIYRKQGFSESDFEHKLSDFLRDIGNLRASTIETMGMNLAEQYAKEYPGRDMTHGDALKFLLEKVFGKKKKIDPGSEPQTKHLNP